MATAAQRAAELLQRAADDEAAASAMLNVGSVTDAIVGFHAQQGVEKSMKAVLGANGVEFPFTHNIAQLATLCTNAGHPLPDDLRDVDRLTPYAAAARYGAKDPELVDRETALRWVTAAIAWARSIIEEPELGKTSR
jgi:HEPN domain-containing protein